jgi:hypothetical protein
VDSCKIVRNNEKFVLLNESNHNKWWNIELLKEFLFFIYLFIYFLRKRLWLLSNKLSIIVIIIIIIIILARS